MTLNYCKKVVSFRNDQNLSAFNIVEQKSSKNIVWADVDNRLLIGNDHKR